MSWLACRAILPSCNDEYVISQLHCAGGKRSGADYSAEATAVREMFEETAGALVNNGIQKSVALGAINALACAACAFIASELSATLGQFQTLASSVCLLLMGLGTECSGQVRSSAQSCADHAGVLSGRDVSGGQLSEVLWYPEGGYALFPLYIPGKPDIPRKSLPQAPSLNSLLSPGELMNPVGR